jgi:hypothetical protein
LNRASAELDRRAPATLDNTTAATIPTSSTRTAMRARRRRISNPANILTAPNALGLLAVPPQTDIVTTTRR